MPTATLTSKGQVTLPKAVRDALQVRTGDRLDFTPSPDGAFRIEVRRENPMSLAGILYRKGRRPVSVREMDRGIERLHRSGR
ncbi:MAG: AbrB/MazE/SpoVT family DNA-binding domain-containing protein [Thermoanaerobaculia bacterium]|nr:AbrB/MazE/SpoVT family DNA-binding domain-containing protein [Thermoanaerobaculia bacterium]